MVSRNGSDEVQPAPPALDDLDAIVAELVAGSSGTRALVQRLAAAVHAELKEQRYDRAAAALRKVTLPDIDYTTARSLSRLRRALGSDAPKGRPFRLAVLGSFTCDQLAELIELYLFAAGVSAEIYLADYGVFRQEILDPSSRLYAFEPNAIFIATSFRDIARRPTSADDRAAVDSMMDAEIADWAALWKTAHDRAGCQIIQNNFDLPPWRHLGNHELRHPGGLARYVTQLNLAFADRAPPYVTIHDVDALSASAGRWAFGDERFFLQAKIPCAPEHLVDYAHSVASLVAAQLGLSKKCCVLDLDNTLWGGVIGDDGLGGIRLGQGDAEGEAFLAFQRYVKGLRDRGVILAVCSKNTDRIAREVFEKHTEMVLRLSDIACFVANWEDKAKNIRSIAEQLNIGLDSLVFVDDNPAERSLVRRLAPQVAVPEVGTDPLDYIRVLERHRYFQVVSLGREDLQRTEYYQANAARREAASETGGVDDFLRSAQMKARIGPIVAGTLERSAQLINKSNQWNLTTRRRTAAEVLALSKDPAWVTRTVSLADRFGDNGLISVILARLEGPALEIDTWLMSCRVLKRGVETMVLHHLGRLARARGLSFLRGEYIPTEKNDLVKDHYKDMGFRQLPDDGTGRTRWELALTDEWQPAPHFIEEIADELEST